MKPEHSYHLRSHGTPFSEMLVRVILEYREISGAYHISLFTPRDQEKEARSRSSTPNCCSLNTPPRQKFATPLSAMLALLRLDTSTKKETSIGSVCAPSCGPIQIRGRDGGGACVPCLRFSLQHLALASWNMGKPGVIWEDTY